MGHIVFTAFRPVGCATRHSGHRFQHTYRYTLCRERAPCPGRVIYSTHCIVPYMAYISPVFHPKGSDFSVSVYAGRHQCLTGSWLWQTGSNLGPWQGRWGFSGNIYITMTNCEHGFTPLCPAKQLFDYAEVVDCAFPKYSLSSLALETTFP